MKLAYLILGHAYPKQIIRLIERLRPSASVFVVHIDKRSSQEVFDVLRQYADGQTDVLLAPRHCCYWGSYGIVQGTFACIRTLLAKGIDFDYAALISGQDYPLRNAEEIAAFPASRPGLEFIEAFSLVEPNRWTDQAGKFQATERVLRYTFWWRSRATSLWRQPKFYAGWEPHGGSQWWCLSRQAVEWLDQYLLAHPALGTYFQHTYIPDEAMIQTMMANSPFRDRISFEALTYVDWQRPNPRYPRTLDMEEEGADLSLARASCRLFARKVDPARSGGWMDQVDAAVDQQATTPQDPSTQV